MSNPPNAYGLNALRRRGITVSRLGCVMLDVQPIDLRHEIPDGWCYRSEHPDRRWISGRQDGEAHVTLLYGLLDNAHVIRDDVDEVLHGWRPEPVEVASVGLFPSPFPDEPYACIVAHLTVTPEIADAHARLSMLPHINTHPEYRPHVTLAYVHQRYANAAIERIGAVVNGVRFAPIGLNYGYKPGAAS